LEKTRIQVLLHEAQLALLSGQQDIYRDSLNQAAQLSESFFATGNNRGNLIRQLDVLAAEPVTLDAPDIAQSLRAVEQLTETLRSANSGGNN
jgi:uroporphyrin-3 C-methyltransferase